MSSLMWDYFGVAVPPQAPVIEGVLAGISVTKDGMSEVGPLEIADLGDRTPWSPLRHCPCQTGPEIQYPFTRP